MQNSTPRHGERALFALLTSVMRRLSDGWLAVLTSAGLIGLTYIVLFAGTRWRLALFFLALASCGGWGIFDRSKVRPAWLGSLAIGLTALVGTFAAFILLFFSIEFAFMNMRF